MLINLILSLQLSVLLTVGFTFCQAIMKGWTDGWTDGWMDYKGILSYLSHFSFWALTEKKISQCKKSNVFFSSASVQAHSLPLISLHLHYITGLTNSHDQIIWLATALLYVEVAFTQEHTKQTIKNWSVYMIRGSQYSQPWRMKLSQRQSQTVTWDTINWLGADRTTGCCVLSISKSYEWNVWRVTC